MSPKRAASNHVATPSQIGAQLRARRQELKLSQSQVADPIGVRPQQVQKYEKGISQMNMTMAQKIARVLGVTLDYFIRKKGS